MNDPGSDPTPSFCTKVKGFFIDVWGEIYSTITIRFLFLISSAFLLTLSITLIAFNHTVPRDIIQKLIIIFYAFGATALSGIILLLFVKKDSDHNNTTNAIEYLWFLILLVGVWLVLGQNFNEFIGTVKSTQEWTLTNYFKNLIEKEPYALFSVVLASLLTDFIIIFIKRLRTLHTDIERVSNNYTTQIGASKQEIETSLINLTIIHGDIKETEKSLSDIKGSVYSTKDEMRDINIRLSGTMEQLAESIKSTDNLSANLLKMNSINKDEERFLSTIDTKQKDKRWLAYVDSIGKVRGKASLALSKYSSSSDLSSQLIASTFIQKFFDDYILQDLTTGEIKHHNEMFANFGIMSKIVCSLLDNKVELYKHYGKRIVYLTTLSMLPEKFLDPSTIGSSEVIQGKWKNYLEQISLNHFPNSQLNKIKENPEKYNFVRICIFSDNSILLQGISTKSDWVNSKTKLISNIPFLETLGDQYQNCFDFFTNHFHTSVNNCRYLELNETSRSFLCDLCQVTDACKAKGTDNIIDCLDTFYKNNPLDIFAIGVEEEETGIIDWKGCLSGYLGGDYNYMLLAWHDSYITPEQWLKIRLYINFLYEKTKDKYLFEISQ